MRKPITNTKYIRELKKISYFSEKKKKVSPGKIFFKGKELYNFSSNDYLGLSTNDDLINRSIEWTKKYGVGLCSSRLVSGNLDFIENIEEKISKLKRKEASLIMGSGFQANSTVIPSIIENTLGKKSKATIFSDKLNHASINYGCILSRQKTIRYNHLDYNHLESLLSKQDINSIKLIVSETVFSMDGDIVDIDKIRFLCLKYNCLLYLDEAHATGVFGNNGFGLTSKEDSLSPNEIVIGTFSKSFGAFGSYISCSKKMKKKIVNCCSGLIYSTALPPNILGAIDAAIDIIPLMNSSRKILLKNSKFMKDTLIKKKFLLPDTSTHIIPIIFECEKKCNFISEELYKKGFFLSAIHPPTVPKGKSRLRISLTLNIKIETIKFFLNTLFTIKK